ncbi:uncharacterized protein FOMMEDRAFT_151300 [Fomitiporia mediterranea MF3/22]|uniref:uncharacterized protein n=1 Tax=Fomitiporia mediterranea (strain MF3/22) TaxID=694068 RepID=UPI0004409206|nr:uncharacterized protein FOMMEDRAFT_151300 [Fomitiporia mediterranea MF3/22]EJD08438.1 hypothetical protein FOMMEDRAFT_151300 [Fomitiporia mediterranea MF3/22]
MQRRFAEMELKLQNPEFHMITSGLRRLPEISRYTVAVAFQTIWGPICYPPAIFRSEKEGDAAGIDFHRFKVTVQQHYRKRFNQQSPLWTYHNREDRVSIRSLKLRKANSADFKVDLDKAEKDFEDVNEMITHHAHHVEEDHSGELRATEETFSAFADDFLMAHKLAHDETCAALNALVSDKLENEMTPAEHAAGLLGKVDAWKRMVGELERTLADAEERKRLDQELARSGQKSSRIYLVRKLVLSTKKAIMARKKASAIRGTSSNAEESLDKLKRLKSVYDKKLAALQRIGQGAAIIFDNSLLRVFVDQDDFKASIMNVRRVFPFDPNTMNGLQVLFDVAIETRDDRRFVPSRDYEAILSEMEWPLPDLSGRPRFKYATNTFVKPKGRSEFKVEEEIVNIPGQGNRILQVHLPGKPLSQRKWHSDFQNL